MNAKRQALVQRAGRAHEALARRRLDPRYQRVLGRMVAAGVLSTNTDVRPYRKPVAVKDVLWAGEIEPRLLELLPALLVKRPGLFVDPRDLPEDLMQVVGELRRHELPHDFRGVPGASVARWIGSVGRAGKLPSRLKAFRLQAEDLTLLRELSEELRLTETAVVRRGLRALATMTQRDA